MLWTLLVAAAATLPGITLSFDTTPEGAWVLPQELPPAFVAAGVQPGWTLEAVDGLKLADNPLAAQALVAVGQARPVRLEFAVPGGEGVVVVVPRSPLVVVEEVGILSWPSGVASWRAGADGEPVLKDASGGFWSLDMATGAQKPAEKRESLPAAIPEVWWNLSPVGWVLVGAEQVQTREGWWAREQLQGAIRLTSFQGKSGDYLALPTEAGLKILSVGWPLGTPVLPVCSRDVPESCLVAGREVAGHLLDRKGGHEEALRMMTVACEEGVWRACLEAVALEDVVLAPEALACGERNVNACHEVAKTRLKMEPEIPSSLSMGVLEYACSVDASGSLGERLRRLEEVGEGCMLLSAAFDKKHIADRALLSLDQACVLGRADACAEATRRRQEAFALRTVRECEDPALPLAGACVQLGKLLDAGPIKATNLDSFGAFLRACTLGEEEGCRLLGDFVDRWGIANPRVMSAERELLNSCSKEKHACVGAAWLLIRHEPRSEEYGRALVLFDTACKDGLASACIAGAGQRRIGKAKKVEAWSALQMWQAACDQESAAGCAGLGALLGRKKQTWEEAYLALTQACDTGEAEACTRLGQLVENRHPAPWRGEQEPAAYLERGCENGSAEGCFGLAELQTAELKRDEEPDEQSYLLLTQACTGDFGAACARLAEIHLLRDTNFDDELAAKHFQSACDNGYFESCRALSQMYIRGEGVEPDPAKARELSQRYQVNADRRLLRLGLKLGFPSAAGGELELVAPIPVGPAISLVGSFSYVPQIGGFMVLLKGDDWPGFVMDYRYVDAGFRLYPNNKARGVYGMVGLHELQATGDYPGSPFVRTGVSGRIGIYSESRAAFTRVEMGIGHYGLVDLHDFDEEQESRFPLIQATLAFTVGFSVF
jgi:TPR repeat protein